MPNIQSAKKKMRKDVTRTKSNAVHLRAIENAIKGLIKLKGAKDDEKVRKTVSLIDKAAKRKVFHKNKASRLKSRITKLGSKKKWNTAAEYRIDLKSAWEDTGDISAFRNWYSTRTSSCFINIVDYYYWMRK